jgi:hypothetical protein
MQDPASFNLTAVTGVLKLDGKVVATQKQLENADKSVVSRKSGSAFA